LIKDVDIVKNAFETAHIEVSPYGFIYKGIQIDMGELSKRLLNMGIVQIPETLTVASDASTIYFLNLNRLSDIIPFDEFDRRYCNGIGSFSSSLFSYLSNIAREEFDENVLVPISKATQLTITPYLRSERMKDFLRYLEALGRYDLLIKMNDLLHL
jgi:hypothetical protein